MSSTSFFTNDGLPECWGHRGASAKFPENTIASFDAAIRAGAHGFESDVHVSLDNVIVMFHDPNLLRTTGSPAVIKERNWYGEDGMEHLRTLKEPRQAIPTFIETIALLMLPENIHVKFNVDVKVQNDPNILFKLMHETISAQKDWETLLAPRILLGLWHSSFLKPARTHLPYLKLSHIGLSLSIARDYFWDCDVFSIHFASLTTSEGQRFREDVKKAGKHVIVWTVNEPQQMIEATRWGVAAILTDHPLIWLDLRKALESDAGYSNQFGRSFLWTSWTYYRFTHIVFGYMAKKHLEKQAGPLQKEVLDAPATIPPVEVVA